LSGIRVLPGGLDLTAAKEFTLHQGTLDVVGKLPEGVEVDFYWSEREATVPAVIKSHARRIRDHLQTIARRSNGRVSINFHDPEPDSIEEEQAIASGLRKVPMSSGDSFFLGATVRQGKRVGSIPYFDIRREQLVDYDVAVALNGLAKKAPPKVGILSSLFRSRHVSEVREGLSFISQLKQANDIAIIPHFSAKLPEGLEVLLVMDASVLQRYMLYAIDQFVMNGGSLIVMMDPRVRFNPPSDIVTPQPSEEINDISDLLQRYGVRYLGDHVTGDINLASFVVDNNQRRLSYPFWLRIRQAGLADSHPVTADLNEVFFPEPGALEILAKDRGIAIVTTTDKSGGLERGIFKENGPDALASRLEPDGERRIIAANLRGPFESAFGSNPESKDSRQHLSQSKGAPVVFALADVDWVFDPFSLQKVELGGRMIVRPLNDNLAFLLNMVEYASGDPALIAMRSRGRVQRPFTRVADLFAKAQEHYREREAELVQRISGVEGEIAKIPAAARLGRRLTVINLVAGPCLVVLFAAFVFGMRRRRARQP
jgi:ABC-2 type transport system permease protein